MIMALRQRQRILGILSQIIFSGTNMLIGAAAAVWLTAPQIAQVALVLTISALMSTLINSLSVTPLSLNLFGSQEDVQKKITTHQRNGNFLIILFSILAAIFFRISLQTETWLCATIFTILFCIKNEHRLIDIITMNGDRAFYLEIVCVIPLVAAVCSNFFLPVINTDLRLLAYSSLSLAASIIMRMAFLKSESGIKPTFHECTLTIRESFIRIGRWGIPSVIVSDMLLSGHVYILNMVGDKHTLAQIYSISLFYRPVSVLLNAINTSERPYYAKLFRERRFEEIVPRVYTSAIKLMALSIAIGLGLLMAWAAFDNIGGHLSHIGGGAIVGMTAYYALQAVRLPINTALQAAWEFKSNFIFLLASVSLSGAAWLIVLEFSPGILQSILVMCTGQIAFTILAWVKFRNVFGVKNNNG